MAQDKRQEKLKFQAANGQQWMKPKQARRIGVLIWDTRRDARQSRSGSPVGRGAAACTDPR
jgi:hypothetical protein